MFSSVALLLRGDVGVADIRETVEQVLTRVRAHNQFEGIVAVCDDERLVGAVPLVELLRAPPDQVVGMLKTEEILSVGPEMDQEEAGWKAAQSQAKALAIVDSTGGLIGILPAHRLLPVLAQEHETDMARLGGFLQGTSRARTASEEPLRRRVWHRAPWLLVGLLGAIASAQIVRSFEGQLEDQVRLALFLPGIIYMADAVGTQTETLLIRGLSVGASFRRIVRLEVLTGAIVGGLLSLTVFPFAWLLAGSLEIALVASLSLLAATSCATVVAMTLPWVLQRLDFDPAFGSGPLATVVQDLISLILYFAIATAVLSA